MVVFSHLGFLRMSSSVFIRGLYNQIFYEGYIGVTFFFILSGFILSYAYTQRFKDKSVEIKGFLQARIARIYPLHILTFLCAIPLVIYGVLKGSALIIALLPNLLLVQSFFPQTAIFFSANMASWFLSDLMFLYILFPFLIFKRTRLLLGLILIGIIWQVFIANSGYTDNQKHYLVYIMPLSRMLDFSAGILLYRFFKRIKEAKSEVPVNILQFFSLLSLFIFFIMKNNINQVYRFDIYYLLPMAFIIFSFAFNKGYIADKLSHKYLILLGGASFSLYMVHQLVIRYVEGLNMFILKLDGVFWDISLSIFCLIVSIYISILLYKGFESKAKNITLQILGRFFNHLKKLIAGNN
jgi:peptidoglycan/LPS O-acetylase OafA/YrhL